MRSYALLPQGPRHPTSLSFFNGKRSPYLDFVHHLEDRLQKLRDLQDEQNEAKKPVSEKNEVSDKSVENTVDVNVDRTKTTIDSSVVYPTWLLQKDLEARLKCTMKTIHFRRIVSTLNQIWIQPNSQLETEFLNQFKRSLDTHQKVEKIIKPDGWGRYMSTGYRKTAQAKAWVSEGTGEVMINGKRIDEYFPRMTHRQNVVKPFIMTETLGTKNTFVLVNGSGHTGQSEAIRLAISKSLASMVPEKKPILKKADMLKRDTRIVERKKYGQRKARRKFQWVKR